MVLLVQIPLAPPIKDTTLFRVLRHSGCWRVRDPPGVSPPLLEIPKQSAAFSFLLIFPPLEKKVVLHPGGVRQNLGGGCVHTPMRGDRML